MHLSTLLSTAFLVASTNAAIVSFFNDLECTDFTKALNVYDNKCSASIGGYQSFKITTKGADDQVLFAWSGTLCGIGSAPNNATHGSKTDMCIHALGPQGGSNSMSSGWQLGYWGVS